jgi:hypothetical protein
VNNVNNSSNNEEEETKLIMNSLLSDMFMKVLLNIEYIRKLQEKNRQALRSNNRNNKDLL